MKNVIFLLEGKLVEQVRQQREHSILNHLMQFEALLAYAFLCKIWLQKLDI